MQNTWVPSFLILMAQNAFHRPLWIATVLEKFLPPRGGERYSTFLSEELAARGHKVLTVVVMPMKEKKAATTPRPPKD